MLTEKEYLEARTDKQEALLYEFRMFLMVVRHRGGTVYTDELDKLEQAIVEFDKWDAEVKWD